MLSGVSVTCFLFSYLVVLVVEASRSLIKIPGRNLILIGMLVAGLIAHSIFLVNQFSLEDAQVGRPQLLANWFQWTVVGAWGLALACLILTLRDPNRSTGLFVIPLILVLIGVGQLLRDSEPFPVETTINVWRVIHGVSWLVGTMFICLGMAFGIMYLVQSYRLKNKRRSSEHFKLSTLEFLQSMNRLSLFSSAVALAVGLLSGIVLNLGREGYVSWFSGDILITCGLFASALTASVLEIVSRGSLGGRRSAYLAIANFVILMLVMGIVLVSSHGQPDRVSNRPGLNGASILREVTA